MHTKPFFTQGCNSAAGCSRRRWPTCRCLASKPCRQSADSARQGSHGTGEMHRSFAWYSADSPVWGSVLLHGHMKCARGPNLDKAFFYLMSACLLPLHGHLPAIPSPFAENMRQQERGICQTGSHARPRNMVAVDCFVAPWSGAQSAQYSVTSHVFPSTFCQ